MYAMHARALQEGQCMQCMPVRCRRANACPQANTLGHLLLWNDVSTLGVPAPPGGRCLPRGGRSLVKTGHLKTRTIRRGLPNQKRREKSSPPRDLIFWECPRSMRLSRRCAGESGAAGSCSSASPTFIGCLPSTLIGAGLMEGGLMVGGTPAPSVASPMGPGAPCVHAVHA
jgi:hypothetical protein